MLFVYRCVLVLKTKQNTKNCLRAVYYYHTNMCILTHHTYAKYCNISFFPILIMAHDVLNSSVEVIEGSENTQRRRGNNLDIFQQKPSVVIYT